MPTYSKYNPIHQTRVPKRKRTIKVYGSGEDDGKWYRCWNCGFINNINRNQIGDGEGKTYAIQTENATPVFSGDNESQIFANSQIIGDEGSDVIIQENPGASLEKRHTVYPVVTSGCSFCSCRNYR